MAGHRANRVAWKAGFVMVCCSESKCSPRALAGAPDLSFHIAAWCREHMQFLPLHQGRWRITGCPVSPPTSPPVPPESPLVIRAPVTLHESPTNH